MAGNAPQDDRGDAALPPERPSRSADAAFQAQLARTRAMTSYERMVLALELGEMARQLAKGNRDG